MVDPPSLATPVSDHWRSFIKATLCVMEDVSPLPGLLIPFLGMETLFVMEDAPFSFIGPFVPIAGYGNPGRMKDVLLFLYRDLFDPHFLGMDTLCVMEDACFFFLL